MRPIDADALMDDVMERYCKDCDKRKGIKSGKWRIVYEIGDAPCRACSVDDMKAELENAPTVEERKKGKWIDGKCNQCGGHAPFWSMASTYYKSRFCPSCGARMEEE